MRLLEKPAGRIAAGRVMEAERDDLYASPMHPYCDRL